MANTDSSKMLKTVGLVVVIVAALAFIIMNVVKASTPEKEEVVGSLPMPEGGGRDAEVRAATAGGGGQATDPTGNPVPGGGR